MIGQERLIGELSNWTPEQLAGCVMAMGDVLIELQASKLDALLATGDLVTSIMAQIEPAEARMQQVEIFCTTLQRSVRESLT